MTNKNESGNQSSDANPQPETPNATTPVLPITPQQGIPSAPQTTNSRQDENAAATKRELHFLEKLNFIGQFCLVIVGVIAAFIYGYQLSVMNRTLIEIQKQTTAAQTTASASLIAAQEAVKQTQNAESFFRTDERALIEIEPIVPKRGIDNQPGPVFLYEYDLFLKNVGKTAAHGIVARAENISGPNAFVDSVTDIAKVQHQIFRERTIDMKSKLPLKVQPDIVPKVLGPATKTTVPFSMAGEGPQEFTKGGDWRASYLVGRIDYRDIFEIHHWLTFCFAIVDVKGDLLNCKYGNNQDNNSEN
jgi:hypothetical protein